LKPLILLLIPTIVIHKKIHKEGLDNQPLW